MSPLTFLFLISVPVWFPVLLICFFLKEIFPLARQFFHYNQSISPEKLWYHSAPKHRRIVNNLQYYKRLYAQFFLTAGQAPSVENDPSAWPAVERLILGAIDN